MHHSIVCDEERDSDSGKNKLPTTEEKPKAQLFSLKAAQQ
jgi:hypothetical protein